MSWAIKGILVGFAFAFFIGPIFFVYLQSSVKRGVRFGIYVASGAWLSDILILTIINLFVLIITPNLNIEQYSYLLYGIGGLLLIAVGMQMYLVKKEKEIDQEYREIVTKNKISRIPILLVGKGMLLNTFNPAVLFYWFGLSMNLTINKNASGSDFLYFFAGAIGIRIVMDMAKIYLGKYIGKFVTNQKIYWLQKATGLVLIIIGIALVTTGWTHANDIWPFR